MKKNYLPALLLSIVFACFCRTALAQVTINIPAFPKINKTKPVSPPAKPESSSANTASKQTDQTTGNTLPKQDKKPALLSFYVEDIDKAKKSIDEYTPEGKLYLVNAVGGEWLLISVSSAARQKWLTKDKNFADWDTGHPGNIFDQALSSLSVSGATMIPLYKPSPKTYAFHSPAEEKMMQSKLASLATLKIIKIGLTHGSWQIDKNSLGIPTDRYKWGIIWARDTSDDHPYCHLYHVNVIQDYAGGGTYAATYAKFISGELVGCQ